MLVRILDTKTDHKSTNEPEDSAEEAERHGGLPSLAGALFSDISPVPDGTAAKRTDEVHKQAEGNNPGDEQDKVDRVVDEAAAEGEEPN